MKKTLSSSSGFLCSKNGLKMSSAILFIFLMFVNAGFGQTTFTWNFGTTSVNAAPSSGSLANLTVGNLTIGNSLGTVSTYITTTSVSSGYTGASGQYNAGNACRIGALNTGASGSAYFEFILTPAAGYCVNLSGINFGTRSTGTAPKNFTVRTDIDNYASSIASDTIISNSTWSLKSPVTTLVTGSVSTPVIVRIYGYNGAGSPGSGTINWKIDDLNIIVSVSSPGTPTISLNGSLNPFTSNAGTPSASQTYTVSGANLSGPLVIVPPSPFEISLDNLTWVDSRSSISLTPIVGNVPATTIYARFNPVSVGSYSGNISHSSISATTQYVAVSGTAPAYYYYSGTGDLSNTLNWGTDPSGTGSNPADFTSNNQIFKIANAFDVTLSSDWVVSGTNSKVILGNGTDPVNFTVSQNNTLTGTIDLSSNTCLVLQNTTVNHTYGSVSSSSTINFAQSGTYVIPAASYGNVILSGGTKTFTSGTTTILGNLTADNVTGFNGSASPFSTVNLAGNFTLLNGTTFGPETNRLTLVCNGSSAQTLTGNNSDFSLFRITVNNSAGVSLSNSGGSSNVTLGNASGGGYMLTLGNLNINNNTLSFYTGGKAVISSGTGTLTCGALASLNISGNGTVSIGTLKFTAGSETINNLTVNITGTTNTLTLGTPAVINGTLCLTNGIFILGANNLTLGSSAYISGSPSSTSLVDVSGTGQLVKAFAGAGTFTYPVGNGGVTPVYSPATLAFTSGTFTSATVGVSLSNIKYSNNNSITDYLKRSWTVTQTGITNFTCDVSFQYDPVDVAGTESNLYVGKYSTYWEILGQADAVNHKLNGSGVSGFSTFTGGELGAMPVDLVSFNASVQKQTVKLSWSTSSETNNSGFEILRSPANSSAWSSVGFVKGSGTKNTLTNYNFSDNNLPSGKFSYRLKQIDNNGNFNYHNLASFVEVETPKKFELTQNYPNPFNPSTKIDYAIPFDAKVKMVVYDMLGREVLKPVNSEHKAGYYTIEINASALSSGIYFYRLTAYMNGNAQTITKRLSLIK